MDQKDLNVRPQTIKILEVNIGNTNSGIAHSNFLFHTSPQAREMKEKINKWDYMKLKSFYTAREMKSKQKGLHQTKKFLHSKGNQQQNIKTTPTQNGRTYLIHLIRS